MKRILVFLIVYVFGVAYIMSHAPANGSDLEEVMQTSITVMKGEGTTLARAVETLGAEIARFQEVYPRAEILDTKMNFKIHTFTDFAKDHPARQRFFILLTVKFGVKRFINDAFKTWRDY
jgi:hypothetical protein